MPRRNDGVEGPLRYGHMVLWTGVDYLVFPWPGHSGDPRRAMAAVNHYARHNGTPTFIHSVEWTVFVDNVSVDSHGRATYTRGNTLYLTAHIVRAGIV
jgi:hypothetical protein